MTFEEQMKSASVLALLVTETGGLEGRLRVQKLMYLLQRKGVRALEPLFFQYHHYGPFSTDVVDMLNEGVRSRIVEEHRERDGEWEKYTYRPEENASRYAQKADLATRAIVAEVLQACRGAHWRTLELAATTDFLRRSEGLDWDTALRGALERKPACKPYEGAARKVIEALALD